MDAIDKALYKNLVIFMCFFSPKQLVCHRMSVVTRDEVFRNTGLGDGFLQTSLSTDAHRYYIIIIIIINHSYEAHYTLSPNVLYVQSQLRTNKHN